MGIEKNIAVLAGDGIGPEIMQQALRVLDRVASVYQHKFNYHPALIGGAAFDECGDHFPEATRKICQEADAILFGSVGGPASEVHLAKWHNCEINSILALRQDLNLSINIRPARLYAELAHVSPLKIERIREGVDILIFRELSGDIYFGEHQLSHKHGKRFASDSAEYTEEQIATIAHSAFKAAQQRKRQVISVDKANVLSTSKLWREVVTEIAAQYPDVKLQHMLVDNCAMQMILNPGQFDVILTANLFGDILSDEASAIPGSLGLMPSASFNRDGFGLYEPSGGAAPDIAGKSLANPVGQILSAAMMLRYSFNLNTEASAIEQAVAQAIQKGCRTRDIFLKGDRLVNTQGMGDEIIQRIG